MLGTERILQLYDNVIIRNINQYNIHEEDIVNGIEVMKSVYTPATTNLSSPCSSIADYNIPAHRCAYLHKYAAFHTTMVRDMMYEAIQRRFQFFYNIISSSNTFKICSLGGGPGTDVIGILAALHSSFSYFDASVTIVDYMVDWSLSFSSILQELGTGFYGSFGNNAYNLLRWSYLGANLLESLSMEVHNAISNSTLITMVKFTSAASCIATENMINNIFTAMRPGAILFFIDNDAGGYHQLIMRAANVHQFISIYGPIRHENYVNHAVKVKKFGYTSCFKTTITVHVLQKPLDYDFRYLNSGSSVSSDPYNVAKNPDINNNPPNLHSPLTPYVFQPTSDLRNINFTSDQPVHSNNFITSPVEEITQSPHLMQFPSCVATPTTTDIINSPYTGLENLQPQIYTPVTRKKGKNKRQGCFPLRHWRNNVSKKINNLKAKASSLLGHRRKNKNSHPVFRL